MGKVLLAAPDDKATGAYIERAFLSLGWDVAAWDYRAFAVYHGGNPREIGGRFRELAQDADLVLVLKGEAIPPLTMGAVARHKPVAVWHFDPQDAQRQWVLDRARAASHFFTIARGIIPFYKMEGVNAHWLSEGCDPTVHKPEAVNRYCAVGFIGTVEGVPGRVEWLARLMQAGFKVNLFGSLPGPFTDAADPAYEYHGRAEPGDIGLSRIVSATRINLGRDRHPEVERSYGARLYRTLSAGGFLLTNRTVGIEEDFAGCLDTYATDEECVERVRYWLEHERERAEVAACGMELVRRKHTFQLRVQDMLRVVGL